jgi:hypothetical protein
MLLYFPSIKIVRCDIVPSNFSANYLLYCKSTVNSPKHYPCHPLIEGKVEFVGKLTDNEQLKFWFKHCVNEENYKSIKGKFVSVLVDFNPDNSTKFKLVGLGKRENDAYYLFNKNMDLSPEEHVAKLHYDLTPQKSTDKKRIKV